MGSAMAGPSAAPSLQLGMFDQRGRPLAGAEVRCMWNSWNAAIADAVTTAADDGTATLDIGGCLAGLDWPTARTRTAELYLLVRAPGVQSLRSGPILLRPENAPEVVFPRHGPATLQSGRTSRLSLSLKPAAQHRLRFIDAAGAPQRVRVRVLLERPQASHCGVLNDDFPLAEGRSDAEGGFHFPAVEAPVVVQLLDAHHVFSDGDPRQERPDRRLTPADGVQSLRVRRYAEEPERVITLTRGAQPAGGIALVAETRTWDCGISTGLLGRSDADGRVRLLRHVPESYVQFWLCADGAALWTSPQDLPSTLDLAALPPPAAAAEPDVLCEDLR